MSEPALPSPDCPHAHTCPGCDLLGAPAAEARAAKRARVSDALAPYPDLAPLEVAGVPPIGPRIAYRERAKLVADAHGRLGLYGRGGHEVLDLPGCVVLAPPVEEAVSALRALLAPETRGRSPRPSEARTPGTGLGAAAPQHGPRLEGADVVRVDDGVLVTLITPEGADPAPLAGLAEALVARAPHVRGVAVSERARGAVQLLGRDLRTVRGVAAAPRRLSPQGPFHLVSHGAFVQAHAGVARALLEEVRGALGAAGVGRGARVLELYAGSGALALSLAREGVHVTAVESFPPACDRLREAARAQGLTLDVKALTAEAALAAADLGRVDAVCVNPPRRGLEVGVRRALGRLRPRAVTYVSCDPDTLARDLSHLALLGLRLVRVVPFDMMPQTTHVETFCVLAPGPTPDVVVLHEDETLLAVDKRPHEPTTPQGEEQAGSLLERVRARAGWAEAVPVHRLDLGTSGVCLFARRGDAVPALAEALARGEKTYVALARGITHGKGRVGRPLREGGAELAAVTRFRRVDVVGGHSLLHVRPETGRTHQIRRHLAALGHPLLGDARHGDVRSNRHMELKHGLDRCFLHCLRIRLEREGGPLHVEAPMAPDLAVVQASLARTRSGGGRPRPAGRRRRR